MRSVSCRRSAVFWVACFAIFWANLQMPLSALADKTGGTNWIEVCTSAGLKLIAVDTDGSTQTPHHQDSHCPFCRVDKDFTALSSPSVVMAFVIATNEAFPRLPSNVPDLSDPAFEANPARAPPAIS
jgi:hypothetical protein